MSYQGKLTLVLWVQESCQADELSYTLAQIQGFELAHLNIYFIYELECGKGASGIGRRGEERQCTKNGSPDGKLLQT